MRNEKTSLTRRAQQTGMGLASLCSGAACLPCEVLLHRGLPRFASELHWQSSAILALPVHACSQAALEREEKLISRQVCKGLSVLGL